MFWPNSFPNGQPTLINHLYILMRYIPFTASQFFLLRNKISYLTSMVKDLKNNCYFNISVPL